MIMKERERAKEKKDNHMKNNQKKKNKIINERKALNSTGAKSPRKKPWRCLALPFFIDFASQIAR